MDSDKTQTVVTFPSLIAPVFTPIDPTTGDINLDVVSNYCEHLEQHGVEGVLVNGTTGEGLSLSVMDRILVTESWQRSIKKTSKLHLMVQIGGVPLPEVIRLAKHAELTKVSSILCLPELYHRPKNEEELIDYLKVVATAAPKTPLLYYHFPDNTNVNIRMDKFLSHPKLKDIKTFAGLKYTSDRMEEGSEVLHVSNNKYEIYLGMDQAVLPASTIGFKKFILVTLNLIPHHIIKIVNAHNVENSRNEAQASQKKVSALCRTAMQFGDLIPALKVAMKHLTPIKSLGTVKMPMRDLSTKHAENMIEEMTKLELV